MKDRHAKGQAFGEARAFQSLRLLGHQVDILEGPLRREFAPRDHLRQDHGDDLQVLDLVLRVHALGPVLHDQDPDRPAAPQQGHAHEGVERILSGLRTVGEGRVIGSIRQVQRAPQPHDLSHETLTGLQPGQMHGVRRKTFGGEELHEPVRLTEVERADLRHHGPRDDLDHHVEPRLDRSARGEGLADLPEQAALPPDGETGGRNRQGPLAMGGKPPVSHLAF